MKSSLALWFKSVIWLLENLNQSWDLFRLLCFLLFFLAHNSYLFPRKYQTYDINSTFIWLRQKDSFNKRPVGHNTGEKQQLYNQSY